MKKFHKIVSMTRNIAVPKEWKLTYVSQQLVLVLNRSKINQLVNLILKNK